jgi:hypothetical protein
MRRPLWPVVLGALAVALGLAAWPLARPWLAREPGVFGEVPDVPELCSQVIMDARIPDSYLEQAQEREAELEAQIHSRIWGVLSKRADFDEGGIGISALGYSVNRRNFSAQTPDMDCEAASELVRTRLLRWRRVEIGLVGEEPIFANPDFQPELVLEPAGVVFALRDPAAERLLDLNDEDPDGEFYLAIDGARVNGPVAVSPDSGEFAVDPRQIPLDLVEDRLLPFPVGIASCGSCEDALKDEPEPPPPPEED